MDDPTAPRPIWMTGNRAAEVLGRRPTDEDADPANPKRIRSKLTRHFDRLWLAEDVTERAKECAPTPADEQRRIADAIFRRWAEDARRRRDRMREAHR